MKSKIFAGLIICIFFLPICAFGATYFVAEKAAGLGDGSSYANRMNVATHNSFSFVPGDTIYLCDIINSMVDVPSSGTKDKRIVYRGDYSGHKVLIDINKPMERNAYGFRVMNQDYIMIEALTITEAGNGIVIQTGSDFISVVKSEIYDCGERGIFISNWQAKCTNIVIGGSAANANIIRDCGSSTASADIISGSNKNITVSYNHLYATRKDRGIGGIWMVETDGFLIERNSIHDHNKSTTGDLGEGGISCKSASNGIIRYNHIYKHTLSGDEAGIRTSGNSHDIRIYGNIIHDNNIGIHPNDAYIRSDGCGDGISQYNIYIFNNLIYRNESYGIVLSYNGHCTPVEFSPDTLKNIFIFNNVIAENGYHPRFGDDGTGLTIRDRVDNVQIRNNIFYKNRPDEPLINKRYHVSTVDSSNIMLQNNQYYWPGISGKAIFSWAGSSLTLAEIKAQKHENDLPAGTESDPGFTDPGNHKYTLLADSVCRNSGFNLGSNFADAIDPDITKVSEFPLSIETLKHPAQGFWARGAYSYNKTQPSQAKLNPPLNLRPRKEGD